jgi:hypothetical protein
MAKYPQWDGKVYKRAKFGDISIKGTAVPTSRGRRSKSRR